MANYWEQDNQPVLTAKQKVEALLAAQAAAAAQSQPTDPNPGTTGQNLPAPRGYAGWSTPMPPPNNMMDVGQSLMPGPANVGVPNFDIPVNRGGDSGGDTLAMGMGKLGGAFGGIGQGIAGIAKSIVDAANKSAGQGPDAGSIYDRIRQSVPEYAYEGPSAEEMANRQYDPVFKMLAQAGQQQEARYKGGAERAKQAYAGFVKDLLGTQQQNAQTYAQTGQQIGQNYDAAAQSVRGNTQASAESLGKVLQQLGIQEGSDTLLSDNQQNLTDELGVLGQNRQASTDLNSQLGANAKRYDADNVNLGRQAGINYQGDLFDSFMQQMNENDLRRLELQGQKGATTNQYDMQIQDLLQKGYGTREQSINDAYSSQLDQMSREQQLEIDRGRLDLDATKAGIGQGQDSNANAYRTLQSAANSYFGNPQEAARASQLILNALRSAPDAKDIGTLLAQIPEEELRKPYMADLAYDFFNRIFNNKGM